MFMVFFLIVMRQVVRVKAWKLIENVRGPWSGASILLLLFNNTYVGDLLIIYKVIINIVLVAYSVVGCTQVLDGKLSVRSWLYHALDNVPGNYFFLSLANFTAIPGQLAQSLNLVLATV